MDNFYVYGLIDTSTREIFYIGKGCGNRCYAHFKPSALKARSLKNSKIKSLQSKNIRIDVEIIKDQLNEQEAFELETQLISKYGRIDIGTGQLTNMTDGGEGVSGVKSYIRTQAHRDHLSTIQKQITHFKEYNKYADRTGANNGMYQRENPNAIKAIKEFHANKPFVGNKNPNAKIINIYNAQDEIQYTCNGNFVQICKDNNLPHNALFESYYMHNSRPIYTKGRVNEKYKAFIGWYAKLV